MLETGWVGGGGAGAIRLAYDSDQMRTVVKKVLKLSVP
jgi:hypothetical protein